jgi:hypothetical protein
MTTPSPAAILTNRFQQLSSNAYLHQPTNPGDRIIIISTWMAASTKLIDKYLTDYLALFPDIITIVLRCSMSNIFSLSDSRHCKQLLPALEVLLAHPEKKVYAAAYSNGGATSLVRLAEMYRSKRGSALPLHGLLLDSLPGAVDSTSGSQAIMASLPVGLTRNPVLRGLLRWILPVFLYAFIYAYRIRGLLDPITKLRTGLNDPKLIPLGGRTYVYSKEDVMVGYKVVEEHAAESRSKGYTVKMEEFKGSKHVAHAVLDKKRYWQIVGDALSQG